MTLPQSMHPDNWQEMLENARKKQTMKKTIYIAGDK